MGTGGTRDSVLEPGWPIGIRKMSLFVTALENTSWLCPPRGSRQIAGWRAEASEVTMRAGGCGAAARTGTRKSPCFSPKITNLLSGVQLTPVIGSPRAVSRRAGSPPAAATTSTSPSVVSLRTNAISLLSHENAGTRRWRERWERSPAASGPSPGRKRKFRPLPPSSSARRRPAANRRDSRTVRFPRPQSTCFRVRRSMEPRKQRRS